MSADDIQKALLSKGYFPAELPVAFTTNDFGMHSADILGEWENSKLFSVKQAPNLKSKTPKRGAYSFEVASSEMEVISSPKRGYERRELNITHPIPQALLSREIARHWVQIQKWLARQSFSSDEIRVSQRYDRAIKGIDFNVHRVKKGYIEATADWLVKTDITRFYPSIYTHSIPWAAYGKEKVKGNLKVYGGSLGDRLDSLIRSCNRNQTVGIPVGPETSRIIAEIISSRIDADFVKIYPELDIVSIDRLQDDWFVGLATLEEAEKALATIIRAYRSFGLDINGSKTSVSRVVAHAEEAWKSELGAFLSHNRDPLSGSRLREFLTLTLRLQTQFERHSVTNYALTVLESHSARPTDIEALESFLLKAAIIAPGSMARISELLINLNFTTKSVSRRRIGDRFTTLAERNLTNGNHYEAIWQLYTLRGLGAQIKSKRVTALAEETPSSALALVLLDLDARGLCVHKPPTAYYESLIDKKRVQCDWTWLLAYEGIRHGWLRDPKSLLDGAFFKPMADRGVVFYDPRRNVPPTKKKVRLRNQARKRSAAAITRLLLSLRSDVGSEY